MLAAAAAAAGIPFPDADAAAAADGSGVLAEGGFPGAYPGGHRAGASAAAIKAEERRRAALAAATEGAARRPRRPYTKRGSVDSTLYTTASMVRTIELILGLPPLTQYDAGATPMFNCFGTSAQPGVYETLAKIDPHYPKPSWKPGDFIID
jgi:hypothetical protein